MSTFVFFHVGPDISQPMMLAHSIELRNPGARIIQCTDHETPEVPRATEVRRAGCDVSKLMIARLEGFAELGLTEPAIYLDTDMLVLTPIEPKQLLGDKTALLCKRSFNLGGAFIGKQRGLDFSEYQGKPLGDVYPYVACATISRDATFWRELATILLRLDPKFLDWYGDQEAMRGWVSTADSKKVGFLSEKEYGCLPEERTFIKTASVLHFKGQQRKPVMSHFYENLFLPSRGQGENV